MAIEDKALFLRNLETELGHVLTVDQTIQAMRAVSSELANYDVEQVADQGGSSDLLDAFLSAKEVEGRSPKTLERYRYIIGRLLDDLRIPTPSVTVHHLRSFLSREKARGLSDGTLEGNREVFSSFFGWLHKEGLIEMNPCSNLSPIKCAKKIRTPYSDTDMEQMKEACVRIRDKAIVFFLRATGCRISEACALNRESINLQTMECTVLGKGNNERTVYFDNVTAMMLSRYLESRSDDNPALFLSEKHHQRLQPGGVRYILKEIEHSTEVGNIHPHRFRRTLATNLIDAGMPIQDVAAILGHEKLDTTMKYVYRSSESIKLAYRRFTK